MDISQIQLDRITHRLACLEVMNLSYAEEIQDLKHTVIDINVKLSTAVARLEDMKTHFNVHYNNSEGEHSIVCDRLDELETTVDAIE